MLLDQGTRVCISSSYSKILYIISKQYNVAQFRNKVNVSILIVETVENVSTLSNVSMARDTDGSASNSYSADACQS